MARIQVDHHHHGVAFRHTISPRPVDGMRLGVHQELLVLASVETKRVVELQRRVGPTDAIDPTDDGGQATAPFEVPVPEGVLLGAKVLLGPGMTGKVFLQFEGGAVDAVAGSEGGGQHQADGEDRRAPALQLLGEDVRSIGPEVGPEVVGNLRAGQLGQIGLELPPRLAPGEVGVGLGEACLGERVHDLRAGEGLGEEDYVG